MRWKKLILMGQSVVACTLWFSSLPMVQSTAPAQTSQETQVEKSSKPTRPRKSTADAASSQIAAPAEVTEKKHLAPTPVKNASDAEIQSAKDGGKVWVNTQSGVYHNGGKWFGATKQGKFMTEQDAIKGGYKAAKNEK